jgi:hypothetical protein
VQQSTRAYIRAQIRHEQASGCHRGPLPRARGKVGCRYVLYCCVCVMLYILSHTHTYTHIHTVINPRTGEQMFYNKLTMQVSLEDPSKNVRRCVCVCVSVCVCVCVCKFTYLHKHTHSRITHVSVQVYKGRRTGKPSATIQEQVSTKSMQPWEALPLKQGWEVRMIV